ncbi:MAG: hypothetical protein GW941_02555 [Candidatus Pacebacteria bacterium]|nr:hypothetical protein [Candidatus Paceibacterota bacterium]
MKIKSLFKSLTAMFYSIAFGLFLPSIVKAAEDDGLGLNVTKEDFNALNPLMPGDGKPGGDVSLTTPGGFITKLLEFAFPLAGIILFVMLVWGGFEMLYGASTSKAMEAGKNRITAAIIGFFLLFSSYWIIQIVEVIFGVTIFL